jgi:hypothetical protein
VSSAPIVETGSWANLLIELTAETADSAFEIIEAKRRLYLGLASEAMRISGAASADVRIYDYGAGVLRLTACAGDGWISAAKETTYHLGENSAGVHAFETGIPFYISDVCQDRRYKPILAFAKSLYIHPFKLHGETIGAVSVTWNRLDALANDNDIRTALSTLVVQFESVFAVLDTREESLIRDLENSVAAAAEPALLQDSVAVRSAVTVEVIPRPTSRRGQFIRHAAEVSLYWITRYRASFLSHGIRRLIAFLMLKSGLRAEGIFRRTARELH